MEETESPPRKYLIIVKGRYWRTVEAWTWYGATIRASVMLQNCGMDVKDFQLIEDDRT